jgi:periplasmic divalent cation tolerance protein
MSDFVLALTTLPGDFDATALAQDLVGAGLAACINIVPGVKSVYTWKGVPQVDQEQQLVIKTTEAQIDPLWDAIRSRHPHDVPEFLILPVIGGSDDYVRWVDENVGPKPES